MLKHVQFKDLQNLVQLLIMLMKENVNHVHIQQVLAQQHV